MKKWWIILLIVLGALLTLALMIAAIAAALQYRLRIEQPMDGPGMFYEVVVDELDYWEYDNVNGGTYHITATRGDGVHLVMERKASPDAEPVRLEADADKELLKQIGDAIAEGGLENASKLPERDPYRMPDTTAQMKVQEPYWSFTVTSLMDLPADAWEGWNKVVKLLQDALNEPLYKVDYGTRMFDFPNAREAYPAGTAVVLYFDRIATDTDYSFYLDGEPLRYSFDDAFGILLTFTMPAHDVTLEVKQRNSMMIDPLANNGHNITVTIGDQTVSGYLYSNFSGDMLWEKLPLTLTAENRSGRELCGVLGPDALPSPDSETDGFEIGDLVYLPTEGGLAILYAQDGERFDRQPLGRIEDDLSFLTDVAEATVTIARAE